VFQRIRTAIARRHVDLRHVDRRFLRKRFVARDWSGKTFEDFGPVGCRFIDCSFEGAHFLRACFGGGVEDTTYVRCNFDRSTIRARAPGFASFDSCTFRGAEFVEMFASGIEMINCDVGATIRKGFFNGALSADDARLLGRSCNRFLNNDFSHARLLDFDFRSGIDESQQQLPPGWRLEA